MEIDLGRGYVATIDDDDYEIVKHYRWKAMKTCGLVYAVSHWQVLGEPRHALMHRLILGLSDRKIVTDHKNGNGLDNRRSNLRACSHADNMKNSKLRAHSASGVKGVLYESDGHGKRSWRGSVTSNGKIHRKRFATKEDAEQWVKLMRASLHGEFCLDKNRPDALIA